MTKITIVFVPVGGPPVVREIDNTLEALQQTIDGYIEAVRLTFAGKTKWVALVDEEGRLKGLSPNLYAGTKYGVIVGPALFTKSNDEGEFVSLTRSEIRLVKEWVELSRGALGLQP